MEGNNDKFIHLRDFYKLKVTEVDLICTTVDKMEDFIVDDISKEFLTYYNAMTLILLSKA